MDALIDTAQAAALLGLSKSLLDHDRCGGGLGVPYIRMGAAVRYDPQALLAWARSRMVNAPAAAPEQVMPAQAQPVAAQPPRQGRPRKAV